MKLANSLNRAKVALAALVFGLLASNLALGPSAEKDKDRFADTDRLAEGKELFTREWLGGDRRSHAGDGLGPLYNARSCAACHNLGGIGGGGARNTNVTIVSVFLEEESPRVGFFGWLFGMKPKPLLQPGRSELAKIHPALRTENSFPFHRFGTEKSFAKWQRDLISGETSSDPQKLDGIPIDPMFFGDSDSGTRTFESRKMGNWTINFVPSERNAPGLFGAGLIDRI